MQHRSAGGRMAARRRAAGHRLRAAPAETAGGRFLMPLIESTRPVPRTANAGML
ncbi:hypothetical protein Pd630_LPD04615 [Rhodococcus opacus PD630]|nr:hypothetical protein Pd630_LPD04615 [Rhodococcus opacus PD630]